MFQCGWRLVIRHHFYLHFNAFYDTVSIDLHCHLAHNLQTTYSYLLMLALSSYRHFFTNIFVMLTLLAFNIDVYAKAGPAMIDEVVGSGPVITKGDVVSVKITRRVETANAQILSIDNDGYEVVVAGQDDRQSINRALLGSGFIGAMRVKGTRIINHQEQSGNATEFVSDIVEVASMLYHLPTPQR